MPVLAEINGITIEMYPLEHPPPHFHARYAEFIIQIDIRTGDAMKGSLPLPQLRRVKNWASTRKDRLLACWLAVEEGRKPEKIRD
jgi:Domain of unknown function (DUF4160)